MFNAWINMAAHRVEYKRYLLYRRKWPKDSSARPRDALSINLARNYAFVATLECQFPVRHSCENSTLLRINVHHAFPRCVLHEYYAINPVKSCGIWNTAIEDLNRQEHSPSSFDRFRSSETVTNKILADP